MMRAIVGLACAASLVAAPAMAQDTGLAATGGCAVVPILPAAIPVVEVTIGGKGPYRFAIDTGARGHGRISPELAAELGLHRVGEAAISPPGGPVETRPVYGAPEVSVGQVSFKNVDLAAMSALPGPRPGWDGVLGNELIQLLPLTLDYGAARARFGGPELSEGLPIAFALGVPVLPIQIAGKRFSVHFDSGNGATALMLDEAAARALPLSGEPVGRGRARTSLGDFAVTEAPLAASVTAGTTPLAVQAIGWPSPVPGGILGSRAMAGLSVTFDAASELAVVERSGRLPRCPG